MAHLGDYDASSVIYGKFTTYRPSTGAAYTLGGTPALSVYKDNSTTQSTTGVTLTADFDTVTGLNHFAIDTSADGTFYSAGSFFDIVITTGTVDAVSVVGAVVASFTIRKDSSLKPTTAGRTLDVSTGGEAGLDWANVGSPTTTVGLSGTTVKTATDVETDTADIQSRLPATLVSGRIDASVGAMATDVLTSTALAASAVTEIQTGLSTLDAAGVRSAVGLASANLDTQLTAIDDYLDTELAAVKATTDKLDTALQAYGGSPTESTYQFTVHALELAPTGGSAPTAAAIADAVWDEARADHTSAGSFGQGAASVQGNVTGSVASVATGGIAAASFAAGAIDAAAIAADAIDASALAADAVTEIQTGVASAVLASTVEGSTSVVQMLRGFAAALLGKASGMATTTAVFRDTGDSKDRITATVDADGNRSAVTLDLT